jgi:gliding motility-associated protein GldE
LESDYPSSLIDSVSGYHSSFPDFELIISIIVLIILLFGSACLSAAELAFFSLGSDDIKKLKSNGGRKSETVIKLFSYPDKLLGTILLAGNLVNIIIIILAGFVSLNIFTPNEDSFSGFFISMGAVILLLVLVCEILPKVYATGNNVNVALSLALPVYFLKKLLAPLTSLMLLSSSFMRKRAVKNVNDLSGTKEFHDNIDDEEKILRGLANFGNINVSAIMCPRIDVTAIDIKTAFDKVIPVIINSGFSRIPVYSGSFDTVKGILYAKDVLPYTNNPSGFKWQSLLRPSYFVPETKKINDLLKEFQLRKIHMAIVIDEYGGTSGIVTLEDILEEIVGEITDESDEDETMFRKIDDNRYIFEGKILLNDFCKIIDVPEEIFEDVRGESETLAGLMLEMTGEIPQKDKVIKFRNFMFTIEAVDKRRVREVRVEIIKNNEDTDQD